MLMWIVFYVVFYYTINLWVFSSLSLSLDLGSGYSMTPPVLSITEEEYVINAKDTLNITCR